MKKKLLFLSIFTCGYALLTASDGSTQQASPMHNQILLMLQTVNGKITLLQQEFEKIISILAQLSPNSTTQQIQTIPAATTQDVQAQDQSPAIAQINMDTQQDTNAATGQFAVPSITDNTPNDSSIPTADQMVSNNQNAMNSEIPNIPTPPDTAQSDTTQQLMNQTALASSLPTNQAPEFTNSIQQPVNEVTTTEQQPTDQPMQQA